MSEKCCGTCRWFDDLSDGKDHREIHAVPGAGFCRAPLPEWVEGWVLANTTRQTFFAETNEVQGADCPVHAFIEAAEDE